MAFAILNRKEFAQYIDKAPRYSFIQTIHMAVFLKNVETKFILLGGRKKMKF